MAFEETAEELAQNVRSLGFDLDALAARKKLVVDHVHVERDEIEENGEYDLDGLFIRLGYAIDSDRGQAGGARHDRDPVRRAVERGHPARRAAAAVPLAEGQGRDRRSSPPNGATGQLTRHGLEEYVSDCVILLDHRVHDQVSTRRLRVVKYRGHQPRHQRVPVPDRRDRLLGPADHLDRDSTMRPPRSGSPAGVPGLDAMLGGRGVYRGSSVLVSGTAGTGKSSLAAHFADASCRRGERCL